MKNQLPLTQKIDGLSLKFIKSPKNSVKEIQTLNVEKLQKYVLSVQNTLLKKQIQIYQWRNKTDFPIVKIEGFKVLQQKAGKTHIEVIINSSYVSINEYQIQNLDEIMYYLKQAIVGFQRLYNKFGTFTVKPEMIVIDHRGKCRVWINENLSLNQVKGEVIDFNEFFKSIIEVFERKTLKTPTSMAFYLGLKSINCFIKSFKYIEDFVKQKKLTLNSKRQMKKTFSTPNLLLKRFENNNNKNIQIQEQKHLRQTISHMGKREGGTVNPYSNALTFSSKSSKPLQKKIMKMIEQLPQDQIKNNNALVLQKFKDNKIQSFKSINQQNHLKKKQKNQRQFKFPCTSKKIEDAGRLSVNQTRSTSFLQNSGERFFNNHEHDTNSWQRFGCAKISEISNNKTSQISEFHKDVQSILQGIDGVKFGKNQQGKSFLQSNTMRPLIQTDNSMQKSWKFNKNATTRLTSDTKVQSSKQTIKIPSQQTIMNAAQRNQQKTNNEQENKTKYGNILDQIQQPSIQQLQKNYVQLGWRNTLHTLMQPSDTDKKSQLKRSFYEQEDKQMQCKLNEKKKLVQFKKLDKVKSNKCLVQSLMDNNYGSFQ